VLLAGEKYESFIGKVDKPNPFALQLSRPREDRNQGVAQQYSRLSILAALKREGARDGDIDLASVICLVHTFVSTAVSQGNFLPRT
jgi:hypothetical protein